MSMNHPFLRKTILLLGFLVLSIYSLFPQFGGGGGNEQDPYLISSPEHLNNIRYHLSAYYLQTTNIDMSEYLSEYGEGFNDGAGWLPIGIDAPGSRFTGQYDGDNFLISNLMINRPDESYIGLFGFTSAAVVKNLGLVDANIQGNIQVGGISGGIYYSVVLDCFVEGSINGNMGLGGLVGVVSVLSTVARSFSVGSVTSVSGNSIGGLIGALSESYAIECYSHADVSSNGESIGGLVGFNIINSSILYCYSTGYVAGTGDDVGGLVGRQVYNAVTTFSFWDLETSGRAYSAGGISKTTEEMKQQTTYTQWNFNDIWMIYQNETYPFFSWQLLPEPSFNPVSGVYDSPVEVSIISSATGASVIYRTASNNQEWTEWMIYNNEAIIVPVASSLAIESYVMKPSHYSSSVAEGFYQVIAVLPTPTASPEPGIYKEEVIVSLFSEEPEAELYYTTDGTEPKPEDNLYTEPISINETTTLYVKAYKDGWIASEVLVAEYIIETSNIENELTADYIAKLYPAFPNPFNPSTALSFQLVEDSYVELMIFNAKGSKIRTLATGNHLTGYHSYTWDGRDNYNKEVPSGIYFYMLKTENYMETRKMMLIK